MRIAPPSASLNANSMIFPDPLGSWAGDYSYYQSGMDYPIEDLTGWVWAAWQIIVDADSITVRQWLKIGLDGDVIAAGADDPTFEDLRNFVLQEQINNGTAGWTQAEADSWVPGDAVSFQAGSDKGDIYRARMYAMSSEPTLQELEQIASGTAPDTEAWGDWLLEWSSGFPDLTDRSGNGRDLSVPAGGTLYRGSAFP